MNKSILVSAPKSYLPLYVGFGVENRTIVVKQYDGYEGSDELKEIGSIYCSQDVRTLGLALLALADGDMAAFEALDRRPPVTKD